MLFPTAMGAQSSIRTLKFRNFKLPGSYQFRLGGSYRGGILPGRLGRALTGVPAGFK